MTLRRFPILDGRFLPSPNALSSLSCPFVGSCCAEVIEVVEIGPGVDSEVAAEAEKTAVSIVCGGKTSTGSTGRATLVNQDRPDGGLLSWWVAVSL